MLAIKGMDHVNMNVKNLEESINFYHKLFNFQVIEKGVVDGVPFALIGVEETAYLNLYEYAASPEAKSGTIKINHVGFHIDNFKSAYQQLVENGFKVEYGSSVDWQHSSSLYVIDPSGHWVEMSEKFGGGHSIATTKN